MSDPGRNPYSNIAEKASMGDFFVAMTAMLDMRIAERAANNGAATAKPIVVVEKRGVFMKHQS
jgi:hypothetical protein